MRGEAEEKSEKRQKKRRKLFLKEFCFIFETSFALLQLFEQRWRLTKRLDF